MKNILHITLNIFLVCCILLGALFLRAFYLKNTLGLTFIELNVYQELFNVRDINSWKDILHGNQLFSVYNILLSCLKAFLGDNTYYFRALSIIFGVITCFISYFLENRWQGFLCLILFTLNSFLINYSQEVGIYSLLGMFATLNIISLIKIKTSDKAHWLWILSAIGMILTSFWTISFILIEAIIFAIYQRKKKFLISAALSLLLCSPYFIYIIYNYRKYIDYYFGVNFDYANIFAFVQNFLSPKLIELNLDNYVNYFQTLFMEINFYSLGFIFIPVCLSVYFIIQSFCKNKFNILIFVIGLTYIIFRILIQFFFGIQFTTGEYIVVLPIFLVTMAYGIDKKIISISLLILLLFLNSLFLIIQENSAIKNKRISILGFSEIINKTVQDNDIIITWVNINDINKVIKKKVKIMNLTDEYVENSSLIESNKSNFKKMNSKNKKDFLRKGFLLKRYPDSTLRRTNILINLVDDGNRIYIVYPKLYDYSYDSFLNMVSKDFVYYKYSYKDLMLFHLIAQLEVMLSDKKERKDEKNNFVVNIYKK